MAGFGARLFDIDAEAGTKTIFHPDGEGGFTLETQQDVESVLEANKILHRDVDERTPFGEKLTRVASIPIVVWNMWKKEGDVRDPEFIRKKLNDPEHLFLRTRPGKI